MKEITLQELLQLLREDFISDNLGDGETGIEEDEDEPTSLVAGFLARSVKANARDVVNLILANILAGELIIESGEELLDIIKAVSTLEAIE